MDTLSGFDRDVTDFTAPGPPRRPRSAGAAGLFAMAGAGAVAVGLFQKYADQGGPTLREATGLPDWRLHLGLAIAAGVAGLAALVGRAGLARAGAGALVVPAVLLATLNAGIAVQAVVPLVQDGGVRAIGLGGWLTMSGAAVALLAALIALAGTVGLADSGHGWLPAVLAALGVAGLLHSWLEGTAGPGGEPLPGGYVAMLSATDGTGAALLSVVGGLGIAATAIGLAAGRRAAAAAGVAFGAAAAAGVDLGVRLFSVRHLPAGTGTDRRTESLVALGATVLMLLLLAVLLRDRPWSADGELAPDERPMDSEPGFDRAPAYPPGPGGPGGPGFGGGPGYGGGPEFAGPYGPDPTHQPDPADRPYQPRSAFDGPHYVPEHDPTPGAAYPLVPDDRVARHPVPPPPGRSRDD